MMGRNEFFFRREMWSFQDLKPGEREFLCAVEVRLVPIVQLSELRRIMSVSPHSVLLSCSPAALRPSLWMSITSFIDRRLHEFVL